jgi:ferredoxin
MSERRRRLRAEVSHDLCVGAAMCIQLAPGAFRLDAAGLSVFNDSGEPDPDQLQEAVDGCPMRAITIIATEVDPEA